MTSKKSELLDIDSLNVSSVMENSIPLEVNVYSKDGKESKITLHIIGEHAKAPRAITAKLVNKMMLDEAVFKRTGKPVIDNRTFEERLIQNAKDLAVRVVAWDGIAAECTNENVAKVLLGQPHLSKIIEEASSEIANFTKPQ